MERIDKFKAFSVKKADAQRDIALINRYSLRELAPEEVYCFSVVLCDNEVDRDCERITEKALGKLAALFVGKTGIMDHRWTAENQIARLYRVEVEDTAEKNQLGLPLKRLRGSAYMMKNEENKPMIDAIDGGILKEVSVGFACGGVRCSCCGKPLKRNWDTWKMQCETGHIQGESYDGKLCCGELDDPKDAYEFSFVAVPAQRGAGVTKAFEDISGAFDILMESDLRQHGRKIEALMPRLRRALAEEKELAQRAEIAKQAQKYR